jgi:hypothetical protein
MCTSTLQYMTPEQVEENLTRAYQLLKPGGEMILRTRVFTSYIGADLHRTISKPYAHLLYGEQQIARVVREQTGRDPRYLNWMTASTYTVLFHRAGFETLDLQRRPNTAARDVLAEVAKAMPIPPKELECAELEARLMRPVEASDFGSLAVMVDTRPVKGRVAYTSGGAADTSSS